MTERKKPAKPHVRGYKIYKGIAIFPAELNSSGIRWYALTQVGYLRADTLEGIKRGITHVLTEEGGRR
jgi:hypothetical protein